MNRTNTCTDPLVSSILDDEDDDNNDDDDGGGKRGFGTRTVTMAVHCTFFFFLQLCFLTCS